MKGRRLPLGGSSRRSEMTISSSEAISNPPHEEPTAPPNASPPHVSEPPSLPPGATDTNNNLESSSNVQDRILPPPSSKAPPELTTEQQNNNESATAASNNSETHAKAAPSNTAAAAAAATTTNASNSASTSSTIKRQHSDASSSVSRRKSYEAIPALAAVLVDGFNNTQRTITVKVKIGGQLFVPVRYEEQILFSSTVGNDGNQYHCQVCKGFGEIVCCDGCPRVYHAACLPPGKSRISLENDDDPWYCPNCIRAKRSSMSTTSTTEPSSGGAARGEKGDQQRRSREHRCVDCHMNRTDLALEPCAECGNYVHHPSCRDDEIARPTPGRKRVLCSTCRAVNELTKEEDALNEARESSKLEYDLADDMEEEDDDDDEGEDLVEGVDGEGRAKRKRRKNGSRRKKRKYKRHRKLSRDLTTATMAPPPPPTTTEQHLFSTSPTASALILSDPTSFHIRNKLGLAQATPAFYFYLAENRWKIERVLTRKHRYFNRLPKGTERNELVAKEAALWWVKLRPSEHRRYMNMSMRDFEHRIIEWKEDKNIQGMMYDEVEMPAEETAYDESVEDENLTYERHERLYLSTSVGSKPFKPEPDQSYNRVLLDLLHDMRFHRIPMFSVNRSEADTIIDDRNSKVTMPYFEVHGPVATCVGDECLGCTRGWTHFCPVMQRQVPAVEHRARLQPPVSSLLATRIGLGLRPRLERTEEEPTWHTTTEAEGDSDIPFPWRDSDEVVELKNLPVVPSNSLTDPSERADDIANFIEETMAMKISEPPRPVAPAMTTKKKAASGRKLPTQGRKDVVEIAEDGSEVASVNKCGRCRTIIYNDTGCVQCRRAQLVINTAKRQPQNQDHRSSSGGGKLKIHTVMLGRVQTKEGSGETQSEADQAIANAMLKERWTPSAILPPQTFPHVPRPRPIEAGNEQGVDFVADEPEVSAEENEDMDAAEVEVQEQQEEVEPEEEERSRRPHRFARLASADMEETDRDVVARENKKKLDELHKRTLTIACCGILLALKRRDPLLLFAEPVTAEGYSAVVKNPIDFGKIRSNILSGMYSSLGAFASDVRLLCENALAFNAAGSIYAKTAKELQDLLGVMQKRASEWMNAVSDAYSSYLFEQSRKRKMAAFGEFEANNNSSDAFPDDAAFETLREEWPEAVDMLENGDWLESQLKADFMRTQENETAYYGSVAVRRVAAASEASLAPYTDSGGTHSVVSKRSCHQDEGLRNLIDERVSSLTRPLQLKDVSTWREEAVVRLMRKVQGRRLERRSVPESGCSRCDGFENSSADEEMIKGTKAELVHPGKAKRKGDDDLPRVDSTRVYLTTGLGSAKTCGKIVKRQEEEGEEGPSYDESLKDVCVSVRPSKIHGWGLFADQPFKKGDPVAEYVGEVVTNDVAEAREKLYRKHRVQDYQCRIDDKLVIDATKQGGYGRYINHNCSPNCVTKIIPGAEPHQHLKRVIIVAQRPIEINEEITYDYHFPLELDLSARVPCNCQSDACRGFMNWDIPEKGSNNRALLVQKRGANMRDRIRRLNRPLKRDEV